MSINSPLISVCIPTYEMHNVGHIFLKQSFDILVRQRFKDFDVVISDHSTTDSIERVCIEYKDDLKINYFKNTKQIGSSSSNVNHAMRHARGKLIKILFQDDFLYDEHSLGLIAQNFDLKKDFWMVTACEHSKDGVTFFRPFYPKYNDKIYLGNNTISSPSVLTVRNSELLFFDENLKWLMDCDYYKRYYDLFGAPKILNEVTVVNRIGMHQITHTGVDTKRKKQEYLYILRKYHKKNKKKIKLKNVTLVAVSSIFISKTIEKLEVSMAEIEYAEVLLISHERPRSLPKGVTYKHCKRITSIDEYSKFMAYELAQYVTSEYTLVIQYDSCVVNPRQWDSEFLQYDYIGAPWPENLHFTDEGVNIRVGNGGFSLRSKKLLNALNELRLPFTDNGTGFFNEDGIICVYYRKILEEYGIRFAPPDVATRFSYENDCPESVKNSFGFHKNKKNVPLFFFIKYRLKKIFSLL